MIPTLNIGIIQASSLDVTFNGSFKNLPTNAVGKKISFTISNDNLVTCDFANTPSLTFEPANDNCSFTIHNVTIGIDFHWQQLEDQSFRGALRIIPDGNGKIIAINIVDIENYLRSVVSSEMNANAPEEFLKAHAVISRSWALAQISSMPHTEGYYCIESDDETIKWYDREAHSLFDLCADDHCQRYQGCTKASTPQVDTALKATFGQVLTYNNQLCDARFSKCCGGITEKFSTCWQPVDLPYLTAVKDPFCASPSPSLLARVLNGYDRNTPHLYRWSVEYSAEELADIIRSRSGIDYGQIITITPLHRGDSGRIDRLEIHGTLRKHIIGKELEIRRTLSRSHLYSSAFTIQGLHPDDNGIPTRWNIDGAGWGHGVGLCQTGAAVMADLGYTYTDILYHYFPGAVLTTIYQS